jgi:hypothetical protein
MLRRATKVLLCAALAISAAQAPAVASAAAITPSRVVGNGTPASCSSARVVAAVRAGGIIRFACGPRPVTIQMHATAKVRNTSPRVVLDGGGRVTLSGMGQRRILYMDTCDPAQVWTTSHCQNQASPQLIIENLGLTAGNSTWQDFDGGGGGAVFVRGGRLRIANSSFSNNRCERDGPDVGGGAVRVLSQYDNLPVVVVHSHFAANSCSNGGALSSIGVSWNVRDSDFVANRAIGSGANPAQSGTPGGGSGGAIYNDGDAMALAITNSRFADNHANEGGGAIFFVSDDRTGTLTIRHSVLKANPNLGFHTAGLPGIFFLGARRPTVTQSTLG